MNEEEILESQNYADDFWPGFVDILSGLILIFSFLVLVAGVVIAVIYQTFSTIKVPPTKYLYILAIIQKSPLMIQAQYDIIETAKKGTTTQVLVQNTKQELEDIAEKTHQVLENFPQLKRKLTQEIKFLQKEIKLVKSSPPPEGQTEKARDYKGGRINEEGADNLPPAKKNWETTADGNTIFIGYKSATSSPPDASTNKEIRMIIRNWINSNKGITEININVANARVPFKTVAQKDSLRRALFVRNLMRSYLPNSKINIISRENSEESFAFGWIRITKVNP